MDLTEKTIKSAFPVNPADNFVAQIELMNMEEAPKEVYYTVDYEYLPAKALDGFKHAKAL
ncbi:hypothetical protein K402DRAFT_418239 [Aulographum hederae CBS 113979]|uniref:Uncharacterized protein n=1 Tax=Aulographum hederae CBS 113979 TaxID=1176131 RepID=A0A6G1HB41_9PEZI|nr:hypothetical protein K402DRAFT_418239 [Aulographum hederae CBS 113979]